MSLLAATLATAGVGLCLAHAVLLSKTVQIDPTRRPVDLLIKAAGLAALLLSIAIGIRLRRPFRRASARREGR